MTITDNTFRGIESVIPHRDPFKFITNIFSCVPGVSIVAGHKFEGTEWFYKGHFPGAPITPGVIQLEAMAQAGGYCGMYNYCKEASDDILVFAKANKVVFERPLYPGRYVIITASSMRERMKCIVADFCLMMQKDINADVNVAMLRDGDFSQFEISARANLMSARVSRGSIVNQS